MLPHDPYEVRSLDFFLPQAALVLRTDHILITGQEWDTISIIPAGSDLEYVASVNPLTTKNENFADFRESSAAHSL